MADLTRTVAVDVDDEPTSEKRQFHWPWQIPAILGALGIALAGWVLLAGIATVVWLASSAAPFGEALGLATRLFALAHGAPVEILGQSVTLVPLGLSILLVFLSLPVAGLAARRAQQQRLEADPDADPATTMWLVGLTHAGVYTLAVAVVVGVVVGWGPVPAALVGAALVGVAGGLWGAAGGLGHDPTEGLPGWLRAVPRGMGAALFTVVAAGAIALTIALVQGRGRIETITESLDPGVVGLIALIVLHLLYLPNLVLWACSWVLGAGVSLGDGSFVSLVISDVGFLPAIPVLGAVPEPGVASMHLLWWLAAGVLAGVLAALAVTWARPRARFDETALVGGLSGVLAGLLVALAASWASGGLGATRLAHIGARTDQLVIFAPTLLGLAGLAAGLVLGLIRRPAPPDPTEAPADDVDETPEALEDLDGEPSAPEEEEEDLFNAPDGELEGVEPDVEDEPADDESLEEER